MHLLVDRISSYPATVYPDEIVIKNLAENGFYYNYDTRLPICYECEGVDEIHREGCFIPQFKRLMNDLKNCKISSLEKKDSTDVINNEEIPSYRLLRERMSTFQDGWKGYYGCEMTWDDKNDYISSPDEIACAGFIYNGTNLECPSCSTIVRFSTHKRISIAEHRKLNPNCTFVKNIIENFEN